MADHNVPIIQSFYKAQVVSIISTVVDFVSLYGLTEWAGIYYVASTALACAIGALLAFMLLRHWAFRRTDRSIKVQAIKFTVLNVFTMILNVLGIYLFTELLGLTYLWSKIVAGTIIGIVVTFPLSRYYVYN